MNMTDEKNKIIVLGIGNILLTDDGAGVHTIEYIRGLEQHWPQVEFLDGGTLGFMLYDKIEQAHGLIVLDATQLDAEPGTVQSFSGREMDHFLGRGGRTVHEVGLIDVLDMLRLTENLPEKRVLVGIQPASLDWGDRPTEKVAKAIPSVADEVLKQLRLWGCGSAMKETSSIQL